MGFDWLFDGLFDDFLLDFGIVGIGWITLVLLDVFVLHPENTVFFVITQKNRVAPSS